MSLKDLTIENHRNAERQDFVKILMSGQIHPDFYATYLFNQFANTCFSIYLGELSIH